MPLDFKAAVSGVPSANNNNSTMSLSSSTEQKPTTPASNSAAAPSSSSTETKTTSNVVSEEQLKEWEKTQLHLASKASFSDFLCNFDPSKVLGVTDYFKGKNSFPHLSSSTNNNKDDDDNQQAQEEKAQKFPSLRWVGGLDISFVKDSPIAVASLVVLDVDPPSTSTSTEENGDDQNASASKTNTNTNTKNTKKYNNNKHSKDQNPYQVVYEDMLHCRMDIPYVPGYLAFREVDPLRQLIKRIKEKAPQFLPQIYFIDGNGLLHYRKCGCAVHFGVLEDVPIVGCAKAILAVDGLGRDTTDKLVVDGTKDPTLVPGTFTYKNTTLVPVRGPTSGYLFGFGALTGNSTAKPIYVSPGHRLSHQLAAMLAVRFAPFRVVEPIRQADLRSRKYISDNFDALMKENQ